MQRQPDSAPVSPPLPSEPPVDCIVEERRVEVYSASLLDHEYTAGPGPFSPGGPRGSGAMAPGVFLTSRRSSLSPPNSSSYSPSAPSPGGLASSASPVACQGNWKYCTLPKVLKWLKKVKCLESHLFFSLFCLSGKRPKKGLATAKQRLGKILKIHRNGKLLL